MFQLIGVEPAVILPVDISQTPSSNVSTPGITTILIERLYPQPGPVKLLDDTFLRESSRFGCLNELKFVERHCAISSNKVYCSAPESSEGNWRYCGLQKWDFELSHSTRAAEFIDASRYSGLEWWDFLPPPTPAPEFRDTIRESGHTCWVESQMDDYAAAMTFLEEDPKVVCIDVRKYSGCQVCELQWRLWSLSENLPVEERAFEADLTELEDMLVRTMSLSAARASVGQNGGLGDYAPTEASAATHPTGNPIRSQITSAINTEQVRVGISLPQTGQGQVKLPWLDFETTLAKNRVRMINWPVGVARPGKDLGTDTSKGIKGVTLDPLTKIYRAIHHPTAPIQLLREETVLPNGLYTMSRDPETSVSRKRTRDSGDDEHETSAPERGGKPSIEV
ncbi:hypothetical protein C8J56DRAFT_891314 [Mycena floridula]|nr:hypothetical protein C8J56DRAFT_891314 [Mycena floridula]